MPFLWGKTRSEEPDHIPSRVWFDNRHWPEGYEFPACESWNRKSGHEEQVVAMLSRIYPDADTEQREKEVLERIRAGVHNYPALLQEMKPKARQVRTAINKYGPGKPEGDYNGTDTAP